MPPEPTYAACLTPAGSAALATIGVWGPDAWPLVQPLFRPHGGRPLDPADGRPRVGRFGADAADQVVLTAAGPRVEIHCHGGLTVVRYLLDLLRGRGAVVIPWDEWLRRTEPEPWRAAAAVALAHALTGRTAAILLDQYHGACDRALAAVRADLDRGERAAARERLAELARWIPLGRRLTAPWRVVLAGAPNAGKSSLLNALLGHQRAITAPVPGTTRDVVAALTAFDGWPVELADTAGLRDEATGLEAAGIGQARAALAEADLVLWVVDPTQPATSPPPNLPVPVLTVYNKSDRRAEWAPGTVTVEAWPTSALTGAGVPDLARALIRRLVPADPEPGAAVPFTADLAALVAALTTAAAPDG